MKVIVTGAAGFIGMHVAERLIGAGHEVVGLDNLSPYYSVALKRDRLARLEGAAFTFFEVDIADREAIAAVFAAHPDTTHVLNLAAQAGVRHSLTDPYTYVSANVMGQVVLLEATRALPACQRYVYASTSSVYGAIKQTPFSVTQCTTKPVSIYAATKMCDEMLARVYADTYGIESIGLRFFTVYGPWGRPDMATWLFTDAILNDRPIKVFNHGHMRRDFTYIDDITAGVIAALGKPFVPPPEGPPHRVYNLGNHRSEALMDFIGVVEQALGREAKLQMEPMQPGDVAETFADITESRADLGFEPTTSIADGIPNFVRWYRDYHGL